MRIVIDHTEFTSNLNLLHAVAKAMGRHIGKDAVEQIVQIKYDWEGVIAAGSDEEYRESIKAFEAKHIQPEDGPVRCYINDLAELVVEIDSECITALTDLATEEVPFIAGLITAVAGALMMFKCRMDTVKDRVNSIFDKFKN